MKITKNSKKLTAFFIATAMTVTSTFIVPATNVKAEETKAQETVTQDSWVDPGNYTRGWYDSVTEKDIYGNTGTEEDPYEIKSAKDLAGLAYYSNIAATDSATTDFGGKYIDITATTIDLAEHYWYPIGAVQNFKGTVDGNDVVIKNMYIGSESKYETCGKVGLFGSIFSDVEDITVKNAKIYSNSAYAGGLVGYWLGGNIANCSVEGSMYHITSSSNVGGFAGYHATDNFSVTNCSAKISVVTTSASSSIGGFIGNCSAITSFTNCYATESVSGGASNNIGGFAGYSTNVTYTDCHANGDVSSDSNCHVGGFTGYSTNGTYTDCYALGNVAASTAYYAGGFIGNSQIGTQKQCFSTGNVTITTGSAGGFIGGIRCNNAYNCYALGNVVAGNNSNVAGFIGYAWNYYIYYINNYNSYSVSMNIENCYSAGSVKAGTNSTAAGFFGQRQYDWTTITFKKDYWNLSQSQVVNDTYRTNAAKVAVTYTEARTVVGAYMDYMKSNEFVADLNEYVYQNADSYDAWEIAKDVNNGYPYISGYKTALLTIAGDSKEMEVQTDGSQSTNDMNVYGTLVFPTQESSEPTPTPDTNISVVLSWGSLEYVYTAGEYDNETKTYADGTWAAKEEGVSDKITLTNKSSEDVEVSYHFTASTETGNFSNLTGTFYQEDRQTTITNAIPVRRTQGDIESIQTVFLNISGTPTKQESITTPEVIGSVLVTVNKYEDVVVEPDETETSEVPAATEEVVTTSEPTTTEEVSTTIEPVASEEVPTTSEPATSEEIPTTSEPVASEEVPATSEPTTTEEVPTTSEPVASEEVPATIEPAASEEVPTTSEPITSEASEV